MRLVRCCWFAVAGCLALVVPAGGQEDRRIDPESGKEARTWPESPEFAYRQMTLEMLVADVNQPRFTAKETLILTPIGKDRAGITLDAGPGISVLGVIIDGVAATAKREGGGIAISAGRPLQMGRELTLTIEYDCDCSGNRGRGLTFSAPKPDGKGPTQQHAQWHSQGEAQDNSRWFLCHDFPNVKLKTELFVTVESGYEVCSNGRLADKADGVRPAGGLESIGYTRWHWVQDLPHPNYLVTLVIGKLAVVDLNPPDTSSARPGLGMKVYTPFGTEDKVRSLFSATPAMVAFFEHRFRTSYPWAKYDQLIVRDFVWGGMENTSATTLYLAATRGEAGDQDDLISHELGHQWFGDLVTCKSWEHLWLNEGWASMCEALWNEEAANRAAVGGTAALNPAPATEAGRKAYQRTILGFMQRQRAGNHSYAPVYPSLVSNYYKNDSENMSKADDVYSKGAMVLHMLRAGLGDEVFFDATREYLRRYSFKCAETNDFRRCMEEACGRSLERFFDQWAMRPGLPRLAVDLDFDHASNTLKVAVEQTQRIDAMNPAYEFRLPLLVKFDDDTKKYIYVDVNGTLTEGVFVLDREPKQVSVDPNLTVIAGTTVRKPLAMWIDELRSGETIWARVQAAEHFADSPGLNAIGGDLAACVADPAEDPVVREAAVRAFNLLTLRTTCMELRTLASGAARVRSVASH